MSSSWKRQRGETERTGWGSDALSRWIGRQRRERRRPAGLTLPIAVDLLGDADAATLALALAAPDAEREYASALAAYEASPLRGAAFESARARYVRADEARDVTRRALAALS